MPLPASTVDAVDPKEKPKFGEVTVVPNEKDGVPRLAAICDV